MNTDKIREALLDLQRQRDLLDNAIHSLQTILVRLNGQAESADNAVVDLHSGGLVHPIQGKRGGKLSYVEAAIRILETAGRPMHVKHIWKQIQFLRGDPKIKRQSVESTLLRHIQTKKHEARIVKLSPGIYGLPKRTDSKETQSPS